MHTKYFGITYTRCIHIYLHVYSNTHLDTHIQTPYFKQHTYMCENEMFCDQYHIVCAYIYIYICVCVCVCNCCIINNKCLLYTHYHYDHHITDHITTHYTTIVATVHPHARKHTHTCAYFGNHSLFLFYFTVHTIKYI